MILDLTVAIALVLAIYKGYQRGFVVGIFSFVAFVVGLAAAIKLSAVVAGHIGTAVNVSDRWLPVISFVAVFIVVALLVRLGANALQHTVEMAMLGWVNRLGGILLYAALYITILSVLLFYAEQIHFIQPDTAAKSVTYPLVHPWGLRAIDSLGAIVPFFRHMFNELEQFFEGVSHKIPHR